MASTSFLVVLERRGDEIAKPSLEALSETTRHARTLGARVRALVVGEADGAIAAIAGRFGAQIVHACGPRDAEANGPAAFATLAAPVVLAEAPAAVVVAATPWGQPRAARLAVRLDAPLVSAVGAWTFAEGVARVTRAVYGGRLVEELELPARALAVLTLRPNLFPATTDPAAPPAAIEAQPALDLGGCVTSLLDTIAALARRGSLADAEVVVAGGRALGGAAPFEILRELADALNGVVGASRAAVDAGWMPVESQVGQTGTSISPKLYVACGISGAMQHRAGIRNARFIAAINTDRAAPIFRFADAGIVGDLFEVVPLLTAAVRRRRAAVIAAG